MMFSRRSVLANLAAACATEPPMPNLNVFELRNYVTHPGRRDELIAMVEAHFFESQEVLGSYVLGTFRNLDDPDAWVWVRAFEGMATRRAALDGFYSGPIWRERREAANATMIDSDNVLLLRPVEAGALAQQPGAAPAPREAQSLIVARTYSLPQRGDGDFAASFAREAAPRLRALNAAPSATFVTEHAANTYPRLPVREGETVFVSFTRFGSAAAYERARAALFDLDASILGAAPEILRLSPSPRSRLR
ncbi:MAG: NIPSNAP family protein [Hyphomonadaceae bacterium]